MKRGKEEQLVRPMFPRLHVKDTDRGPRAPPRNKMALYEQLSIPSNRFTHSAASLLHPSSQGNEKERDAFPFYHMPTQYPDLDILLPQIAQRKKLDNDEFAVPIHPHSGPNQENFEYTNRSRKCQKSERTIMVVNGMKQENKSRRQANSVVEKAEISKKQTDGFGKLSTDDSVEYSSITERCNPPSVLDEDIVATESTSAMDLPSDDQNILNDIRDKMGPRDTPCPLQPMKNLSRVDSLSKTLVVDSVSRLHLTPDDMVGIIGQKQFWKARRDIVNQQRIFSVQVFELHRLIKVQKLIAASPHILVEDVAYFTKPAKTSPLNDSSTEGPDVPKPNNGVPEKPTHKTKPAVQNATEKKSPHASVHNMLRPRSFLPLSGDAHCWAFSPQPHGNHHHWLIPVMSPSEGLVYKPYPEPAFVGPPYRWCGLPGSSNFPNLQFPAFPPDQLALYRKRAPHDPAFSGSFAAAEDIEEAEGSISPVGGNGSMDEGNVLPLFPTNGSKHPPEPEGPGLGRVIKAVPHNARSANESAARIFQAIQQGRKLDDLC